MKFQNCVLSHISYVLPETILTSEEIELKLAKTYERLKLQQGRLELMTGIKARHFWEKGTRPSTIATQAANKLITENNIDVKSIDLLIFASVCRDFLEPATASVVHANLNLRDDCEMFDLSNACLGVVNGITLAAKLIESKQIKRALIVSGENSGPLLLKTLDTLSNDPSITRQSIKKFIANLTIGSAGVAVLVDDKSLNPNAPKILGGAMMVDSSANTLCQGSGNIEELSMETDSEELLKVGVILCQKTWKKTLENLNLTANDFKFVVGHQVGTAHEKTVLKSLELDRHQTFITYPFLGNTGSAALPITLKMLMEKQVMPPGTRIGLIGIGSGLSSIMLGVEC
jgi:3-oxoacyl-[acyl-carrier-protein] synthase-3